MSNLKKVSFNKKIYDSLFFSSFMFFTFSVFPIRQVNIFRVDEVDDGTTLFDRPGTL